MRTLEADSNLERYNYLNRDSMLIALIPAYNEELTIEKVVRKTKEQNVFPIVIDDGSSDKTFELASRIPGVLVIRNKKNMGKAAAIQLGRKFIRENSNLLKAKAIVILDADSQYDQNDLKDLTKPITDGIADIVLGFRFNDIPYFRHYFANKIWRLCVNFLYGYKDVHGKSILDICALRAYSMKTFMDVDKFGDQNWLTPKGYITEIYVLIEAIEKKLKIDQIRVRVNYDEKSSILRGVRMFFGIEFYILKKGIPYFIKRLIK